MHDTQFISLWEKIEDDTCYKYSNMSGDTSYDIRHTLKNDITRWYKIATHLDVNSLEGFKMQADLKSTIKALLQSYLHLYIKQKKYRRYQEAFKDKLGKIIQYLVAIDATSTIVKHSEHAVTVQDNFLFQKMKLFLKLIIFLNLLWKTCDTFIEENIGTTVARSTPTSASYIQRALKIS